jgi:hypothetical protein
MSVNSGSRPSVGPEQIAAIEQKSFETLHGRVDVWKWIEYKGCIESVRALKISRANKIEG